MSAPTLQGDGVELRAIRGDDLDRLHRILCEPEVARWWRHDDRASLERLLTSQDDAIRWTAVVDDAVAGMVQAYEESDPAYRHAGIDLFLDPACHGRGLGREAVRLAARWLLEERGHHRLVIDSARANERAIRCYEAAGFSRVGVMREHWHDHVEERWVDGVMLDLIATDLDRVRDPSARGAR
jgi:aminoglycoside 6'-N-acetyltransferase